MLERLTIYDPRYTKRSPDREKCGLIANLNGCKFPIGILNIIHHPVRKIIEELGFKIVDDEDYKTAFLIWSDVFVPFEKLLTLQQFQRVNHFPGMIEICRKDFFTKNYNRHAKQNSSEYDFYPRTWILPREYNVFQSYAKKNHHPTYILKPANGAMGIGIRLFRHPENVPASGNQTGPWIVQEYIDNPLLIDGYKCDLRVYVLVTSCCPLRIFVYNEGLVRLSAEKYRNPVEPNGESVYRHLTNYALNKKHRAYVKTNDESEGSKRSFAFLEAYLRDQMNVNDPQVIWRRVRNLIVKTIILGAPHIYHGYRLFHRSGGRCGNTTSTTNTSTSGAATSSGSPSSQPIPGGTVVVEESCGRVGAKFSRNGIPSAAFEILGFDILLDRDLRPWLIEVNRSPSFGVDQNLDLRVKSGVLKEALKLINIRPSDKRRSEDSQRACTIRRLLTPTANGAGFSVLGDSGKPPVLANGVNALKSPVMLASDWLKNPKDLLQRIGELKEHLRDMRHESEMECFENSHCGNWRRVYPTMDKTLEQRYGQLLVGAFTEFNKGRPGEVNQVIQVSQSGSQQENDLQQQLDYLEREAGKLFQKEVKIRRKKPRQPSPASRCLRSRWRNQSANSGLSRPSVTATSFASTRTTRSPNRLPPTPFWDDPDAIGDFDTTSSSSAHSSPLTPTESFDAVFEEKPDFIFGGSLEVEEVNFSRLRFRHRFSAAALRRQLTEQRALASLRGFTDSRDDDNHTSADLRDTKFPVTQRYKSSGSDSKSMRF